MFGSLPSPQETGFMKIWSSILSSFKAGLAAYWASTVGAAAATSAAYGATTASRTHWPMIVRWPWSTVPKTPGTSPPAIAALIWSR